MLMPVSLTVPMLPARSVARPVADPFVRSVASVTGGVSVSAARPDNVSVAAKVTVTGVVDHELAGASGDRVAVIGPGRDQEKHDHVGAHITTIVIHRQGIPKVVRAVTRGGAEWTDLLVTKGGMQEAEAEAAKCAVGVTSQDPKVSTIVGQAVRPLVAEIRSSIQYFGSTNPGAVLERVALAGRSSQLPGLAEMFSDQLGVPTNVADPMRHVRNRYNSKGEPKEHAATAVSVGLAIGAVA